MVYIFMVTIAGVILGWLLRGGCEERGTESKPQQATSSQAVKNEEKPEPPMSAPLLLSEEEGKIRDDLTRIKGIGNVLQARLNTMGIYRFSQIAAWSPAEAAWIDKHMSFPGRVEREAWVKQAKLFVAQA